MTSKTFYKLPGIALLLAHSLIACGTSDQREDDDRQGNQWTVGEEGEDMSSPSSRDMSSSQQDMSSTPDLEEVTDMPIIITPVEDMPPVTLDAEPDMPPTPPSRCEESEFEVISVPQRVTGRLAQGFGVSLLDTPCGTLAHTRKQSYTLRVEREALVDIWIEDDPTASAVLDPRIVLDEGCEALAEGAQLGCGGDYYNARVQGRAASIRQRLAPGDYTVTVVEETDEDNPFVYGGRYALRVSEVEQAPHGICEGARPLPIGQRLDEVSEGGGDQGSERACFVGGNLMYYTVEVPAGQTLSVEARYASDERPVTVDIDTGCEKNAQSLCTTDTWSNRRLSSVVNDSDTDREYIVALDVAMGESYWVEANLYTPYENGSCERPLPVEPGQTSPEQSWEGAGPDERLCYEGSRGRALYYRVDVPPMHRLYPDDLTIVSSCDATTRTCQSGPHVNTDTLPLVTTVMTSTRLAGADDVSQISPYVVQLAPNSICRTPTKLVPGVTLTGQESKRGFESFNPCQIVPISTSSTLYYTVEVQLGGSDDIRVIAEADEPRFNNTLSLQVLQHLDDPVQCFIGTCITSSDGYFRGDIPAEVTFDGTIGGGASIVTALIAVTMDTGYLPEDNPTFSIRAEYVTP